jgi:hypothetical protein
MEDLDKRESCLNVEQHFAKHGWAYVPNLVEKYECEMLTNHLLFLDDQGKMKKDRLCSISSSIYGDSILDKFLELNRSKISKLINISLLPTYTYARIYKTKEVLPIHRDRPSCEISATITLGNDENSKIWPFFFSKINGFEDVHRQVIEVGGAVLYRGMDLWHWRQEYRGKWQTQVFLHYVDANGKYADQAYDGREGLGSRKRIKKPLLHHPSEIKE